MINEYQSHRFFLSITQDDPLLTIRTSVELSTDVTPADYETALRSLASAREEIRLLKSVSLCHHHVVKQMYESNY